MTRDEPQTDDVALVPDASPLAPGMKESDVHVHAPKAGHGWRDFFREIGIVMIGILLAIGCEQIVEEIHWTQEVQKARKALHNDIAELAAVFRYRIAVDKCVRQRLEVLGRIIEQPSNAPDVHDFTPAIGFALSTNVWQVQQSSQVLTHFNDEELFKLGSFYFQTANMQRLIDEESHSWQKLEVLIGRPSRLGPSDIANLRIALSEANVSNSLLVLIATEQMEEIKKLGVKLPATSPYALRMKQACMPVTG